MRLIARSLGPLRPPKPQAAAVAAPAIPDQATIAFRARRDALARANVRLVRSDPADGAREFFVEFRGVAVRAKSLTAAKNVAWRLTHQSPAAEAQVAE